MTGYVETYRRSLEKPEEFWAEAAEAIEWERRWDRVLDDSRPPFYRWFAGARLNTCWNALDRHVAAGHGERLALIWDSPVTEKTLRLTYRDLRDRTARFAGVLAGLGVKTGDRILIYMPMVPEAAIAMLACARIGAIHSVVFGGFAAHELATRIDDAKPRVIVSASCGIETSRIISYKPLLDAAIAEARPKPEACVILQPLLYGCTSVIYEGKPVSTPDAGAFWRVIAEHQVRVFFTAPTAFRAIRQQDPDGVLIRKYDLSRFRALFLAGERADPPTVQWAEQQLNVPVIDHWWQTETGWPIGANCLGIERLPVKHGSCTRAVPGSA